MSQGTLNKPRTKLTTTGVSQSIGWSPCTVLENNVTVCMCQGHWNLVMARAEVTLKNRHGLDDNDDDNA